MEGLVACPVCTLYLREGMSLNSHLETHPKDQVIEALVRCVSTERERAITSSIHPGHSTIINPFQVVSEEHIFFGRQQVTTNILAPLMTTYPIYPQQQILHGAQHHEQYIQQQQPQQIQQHQGDQDDVKRHSEVTSTPGANDNPPEEQVITTLMNVPHGQHEFRQGSPAPDEPPPLAELDEKCDYEEKPSKIEPVVITVSEDEDDPDAVHAEMVAPRKGVVTPTGVIHTPMMDPANGSQSIIAISNVERDSSIDQYITSDFQDEDARHSEDFIDDSNQDEYSDEVEDDIAHMADHQRRMFLEEQEDDVEACSDSGLQNIQADECMPARGELSGHGSVNTAHSWDHDEIGMPAPIWEGKTETLKRYPCLYCEEVLACPKERRAHVAAVHCSASESKAELTGGAIMCIKCGLQLASLKDLRVHIKGEHKKLTRQCCVCQEEFKSQEEYTDHIVNVHPLECRTCGKTFKSKASLVSHAKVHLVVKPHACTLCPKTFITSQKLKEHMNGHTGYAPIQCNLCDKKFKRYSNLKQHKDNVHFHVKKPAREYFCECGETFVTKKKLEWHKETHDDKPKQCMYCSERYIHSASLTRHIRKAHNNEYLPSGGVKKKNVVCPICNLTFVDTSLRAHMKQHGTVKQFGCIVCGKKFYTKWNLHLHRWTHASRMSKPYKCTLCKNAFIRQQDLQAHIRSHFNSKPFTCNHCGMQFNRKHNWSRHEKEHLTEKKFICNECGKTFHRQYYLVEHVRTHTGAKPYSCHICNKTSSTKSNHNKHIRTHHAREAVNTES